MEELFNPLAEVGLLRCYKAIADQIDACADAKKQNNLAWGFWQITQQVRFPKIGIAIKTMVDDVIESPEDTEALLPALRQVIEFALADAEKRWQEEERLADERYNAA